SDSPHPIRYPFPYGRIPSPTSPRLHSREPLHSNGSARHSPAAIKRPAPAVSYLIISGGTGANSFASAFGRSPAFVLPVSDDGGSSSEILRCFAGPSIGDIRSRLIRLIPLPNHPETKDEVERMAIFNLMSYRFPIDVAERVVRDLWLEVVEGRSELWSGIGEDKKECIRAFLVHFQTLCLRRAHKRFSFLNFSLGNGFLTGARDLFGSLPSAIFLFKSVAGVSQGAQVIPVINTNREYARPEADSTLTTRKSQETITIAAQLANSTTLIGQCTISHPSPPATPLPLSAVSSAHPLPFRGTHLRRDSRTFDTVDTSLPPSVRTSPSTRTPLESRPWDTVTPDPTSIDDEVIGNIGYRKGAGEIPLEARIERLFYINLYSQEVFPEPNPEYLEALNERDVLVYSCGSLWTSIIPCLALRGLATAIGQSKSLKAKVLLLNSKNDRETPDYVASEYINNILDTLRHYDAPKRTRGRAPKPNIAWESRSLLTHIVYLEGGAVEVDREAIEAMGIEMVMVPSSVSGGGGESDRSLFNTEVVEWAMERILASVEGSRLG
ncbi:hypothetical protein P7C73_g3084, partial [Tremellales sp. Uapishka_1]